MFNSAMAFIGSKNSFIKYKYCFFFFFCFLFFFCFVFFLKYAHPSF